MVSFRIKIGLGIFMLPFLLSSILQGQSFQVKGQASSWAVLNLELIDQPQGGLRYIPGFSYTKPISENGLFDLEVSVNILGSLARDSNGDWDTDSRFKPYRLWLRYSNNQFEARIGLQKINFGSANMLRPLMWFDKIDPRDPLRLTDGVWGALFRYYFLNNTNIWFWALTGNTEPKGWEFLGSDKKTPEFGGRLQVPVRAGEAAFTFHRRRTGVSSAEKNFLGLDARKFGENRYAIDCRWDIGVGLWIEGALIQQDISIAQVRNRRFTNIGLDYTFGIGNGIFAMAELFRLETADQPFSKGERIDFSVLLLNYSLGLLDAVTAIVYRDWKSESWYRFINFQRTTDQWQFFLMAFWNPDKFQIYQNVGEQSLFAGKGIQLMAVFNH